MSGELHVPNLPTAAFMASLHETQIQVAQLLMMKMSISKFFLFLPSLSSIHEKVMYCYVLDGESALAWELPFSGHPSST